MLHRRKLPGQQVGVGAAFWAAFCQQPRDDPLQLLWNILREAQTGGGSDIRCICSISGSDLLLKGGRPASMANRTQPRL